MFIKSCSNGHIKIAQWLFSFGCINFNIYDCNNGSSLFDIVCYRGHTEMAKWLYSIFNGAISKGPSFKNIHDDDEHLFRITCLRGHLETAKGLYSLKDAESIRGSAVKGNGPEGNSLKE